MHARNAKREREREREQGVWNEGKKTQRENYLVMKMRKKEEGVALLNI